MLDAIQENLLDRATRLPRRAHRARSTRRKSSTLSSPPKNAAKPEIHGGFALAHWNGSRAVEEQIKDDLKVTIRCIPFDDPAHPPESGKCVITGEPSARRVIWAKSY